MWPLPSSVCVSTHREEGEREDEGGAQHVEAEAQVAAQHQEAEPRPAITVQQPAKTLVHRLHPSPKTESGSGLKSLCMDIEGVERAVFPLLCPFPVGEGGSGLRICEVECGSRVGESMTHYK